MSRMRRPEVLTSQRCHLDGWPAANRATTQHSLTTRRRGRRRSGEIAAGLLLLATVAAAQPIRLTPPDPVADRLVAEALGNAPEVSEARAALEAARHRIEPARTLPDPSASLTYQNDG